jgi:fluoride exporter
MNFLLVFIGGGLGSMIRYALGIGFLKSSLSLPLATLSANLFACILFAFTLNFIELKSDSAGLRALVLTGICGGLSTFSTFGYESFLLLRQQSYAWLAANILISVILCVGSFILIRK